MVAQVLRGNDGLRPAVCLNKLRNFGDLSLKPDAIEVAPWLRISLLDVETGDNRHYFLYPIPATLGL